MNDTLLEPTENHLRAGELVAPEIQLVVRGWPLTVTGLERNARTTAERYSFGGAPMTAVSAALTSSKHDLHSILSDRRMRTRTRYAASSAAIALGAGFRLLATFDAPHYSVAWVSYTRDQAELLRSVLSPVLENPHHLRRPG
jgi:hypothetical protein